MLPETTVFASPLAVRDMIEKAGAKYLGEGFQDERIIKPEEFAREAELRRLAETGRAEDFVDPTDDDVN